MALPPPLASGRDADVYPLDDDRVLRRYRLGGDVAAEAAVMDHLHARGYPVPRVHHAAGPDLVLDRLTGPTLAEAVLGGAVDAGRAARILADLHRRLHALPARRAADPADRVLHLDLHPQNILLTAAGPVVIDWGNATEGPPGLDVAMSAVILAEVATEADSPVSGPARDVLVGYLAETGPLPLLERSVALRAELGPLGPERLGQAAALVRRLAPTATGGPA
ncbi:phosphotransferase [Micromonospora endolithica]|uniref:phosphotransferase n=1 Tax=Micromonospora endolithica TaxID=230091 RepID=UPI0011ABD683|nr:phosphotransferase [Micromonospora endolithica]TWJ22325.1 phosphotransferase family enzyme [Micromonospora endolithica]